MTRPNPFKSVLGLLVMPLFLLSSAVAWAEHHENEKMGKQEQEAEEPLEAEVSRLAHELADLLERGVELGETEVQVTAFQQRERDAAQSELRHARDAARKYVRELEEGVSLSDSESSFRAADGFLRAALKTAGDAEASAKGAPALARLDKVIQQLERIYDEL